METATYSVHPPDDESEQPRARKTGYVQALLDGTQVGMLQFGLGPGADVIRTTDVWVEPSHQRRGIATGLYTTLLEWFQAMEICESPMSNTDDGDGFLEALRTAGVPCHRGECFFADEHCMCELKGRVRSK